MFTIFSWCGLKLCSNECCAKRLYYTEREEEEDVIMEGLRDYQEFF